MANLYTMAIEIGMKGADSVQSGLSSLATGGLGAVAVGGAAAAGAIVGIGAVAFDTASDINAASNQMTAALGLTDEEAANLNQTMQNIYANNYGESFEDIAASLVGVEQAFARVGDLSEAQVQQITQDAIAMRDVFGVDVAESANAAATLVEEFGITTDEAMDFLASGFQNGLDASGDFLDTIGEYSTQFSEGGANAEQFFSLMQSGAQGGMLGVDRAADAFKEFQVRILDGSTLTAESLEAIGINSESFLAGLADGSMTTVEAFEVVNDALAATEDQSVLMQAGVGLIGTQFEDLGASAALALTTTGASMEGMAGATDSLNVKYNDLSQVGSAMWRQFQIALAPIGQIMLDLANQAMPSVQAAFTAAMPYIQQFADWLGINVPIAIQFLSDAWNNQLQPALVAGGDYFNNVLMPVLRDIWEWIDVNLMPTIINLGTIGFHATRLLVLEFVEYFNNDLMPAMNAVWSFVVNDLGPVWEWLGGLFASAAKFINDISNALAGLTEPPEWMAALMPGGGGTGAAVAGAVNSGSGGTKGGGGTGKMMTTRGAQAFAGGGGYAPIQMNFYGNVNDAAALQAATESGMRKMSRARGVAY